MAEFKGTPAPWAIGEYSDTLGYDCMYGGVRVGPVVLDGQDYGQKACTLIEPKALAQMMADAQLIAAAHEMRDALRRVKELASYDMSGASTKLEKIAEDALKGLE